MSPSLLNSEYYEMIRDPVGNHITQIIFISGVKKEKSQNRYIIIGLKSHKKQVTWPEAKNGS